MRLVNGSAARWSAWKLQYIETVCSSPGASPASARQQSTSKKLCAMSIAQRVMTTTGIHRRKHSSSSLPCAWDHCWRVKQIGRASGRERVCQSVEITVADVYKKKK